MCIKCRNEKEAHKRCKYCKNAYAVKYRKKYYEKVREYEIKYRKENYDTINERAKTWYQENCYLVRERNSNNREYLTVYHNNYESSRKTNDPAFKLRKNCSRLINIAFKGNKNNLSILDYLPYTMNELKKHLERQFDGKMNWNNYGSYWHIDHIYPQSLLPYISMEDDNFKRCWALDNLQPLEAVANIKKSNKVIK